MSLETRSAFPQFFTYLLREDKYSARINIENPNLRSVEALNCMFEHVSGKRDFCHAKGAALLRGSWDRAVQGLLGVSARRTGCEHFLSGQEGL